MKDTALFTQLLGLATHGESRCESRLLRQI